MARLTHKGWLLFCPIYLGDLEADAPLVTPRRFVPELWLDLNEGLFGVLVTVVQFFDPTYEPRWPLLVTGELPDVPR